jgi:TonB-dependent receptor
MINEMLHHRAISRPGLGAIAPSVKLTYNEVEDGYAGSGTAGNPDLDAVRATNLDLSYEWYYAADSMFSVAAFYKDIDSTIGRAAEPEDVLIDGELFAITTMANLPGTTINGLELAVQHGFTNLPGILSSTGLGANYTFISEDSDAIDQEGDEITRVGLSEHSYNLSAYYDDGDLSIRIAYNWRDDFVMRQRVALGWNSPNVLPEYEAARGQLDISANYQLTENLKINFSASNLNDSETRRYLKHEPLHSYLAQSGARYNLGAIYRF